MQEQKPLLVLKPDKDSPEKKQRGMQLSAGAFAVMALWSTPLFLPMSKEVLHIFGIVATPGVVLIGIFIFLQLQARGGLHLAYEFYADRMELKQAEFEKSRRSKGNTALYYFEIAGLETVANPHSFDGKLVDIHVKVTSPLRKRVMCGSLNFFDKEFYLYNLLAEISPQQRIQEIMDADFKNNPDKAKFRQKLIEEEQLRPSS